MLVAGAYWRTDGPTSTVPNAMARPELAHYVEGWPRPGDMGAIAEAGDPIGAAWLRFFSEDDPGYGFINAATPELSVGVRQQWRRQGVGTRLLSGLLAEAREGGLTTLSLSVERDNAARRIYERLGFQTVEEVGGSLAMLLQL
jgi:GNAT superfamily N-acetyltransferase